MLILEKKIHVPIDVTAKDIIANTKLVFEQAGQPITYFDEGLEEVVARDLERVRGKTLDILTWNSGRIWETQECRDFQKRLVFDGNAAACFIWVAETKPHDWFVSIPNDEAFLHVPFFSRDNLDSRFYLIDVRRMWDGSFSSVSFRVSDLVL